MCGLGIQISRVMSLCRYFNTRDGLPDPGGSHSTSVPSAAIRAANKEVEKALKMSA